MAEWLKVLLGTCSGVIVGLLVSMAGAVWLEPWKQRRLRRENADKARNEIYRELGHLYFVFVLMNEDTVPDPAAFLEERIRYLTLDAYDYYYGQKREIFYAIRDWIALRGMVELLTGIRHEMLENRQDREEAIEDVVGAFQASLQSKELDQKLLRTYADVSTVNPQDRLANC